jgi:hypothetical protein
MSSLLERLQTDIGDRLNSLAYFADVTVYVLRPRVDCTVPMLQQRINAAIKGLVSKGGKAGVCVFVAMPTAETPRQNVPGPEFSVSVVCQVVEKPVVNMGTGGTGKSAEEIALEVAQALHHWRPSSSDGGARGFSTLYAAQQAIVPVKVEDEAEDVLRINVTLEARLGLGRPSSVADVTISGTSAAVTLTCATAGAAIYYTTDESFPWLGNTAATLYSAPFAVTAGDTVRAAGYKTSLNGSNVSTSTISS